MVTENKSAQELAAIVVGVSVTVALLLITAVTVISAQHINDTDNIITI